jgi:uncharacterized protein (DUF1800 family)
VAAHLFAKRARKRRKKKHSRKHYRAKGKPKIKSLVPAPKQPPKPAPHPGGNGPVPVYGKDFGNPQLKRLLWRAGFGPRPGDVDALAGKPIAQVVQSLTRPNGAPNLVGPEPRDADGPIAPLDAWGHDHLWWLDRMVRTDQQLVERMTLIWHDWFATSNDGVGSVRMMLDQNDLFRNNALGSFKDLLLGVTTNPAMLVWLNGIDNRKNAPNENYAREVMELFTLGAGRGAYTETDVRQLALALTGWRADWVTATGWQNFRYDATRHDTTTKTVFGRSGNFAWQDAIQLVLENPYHASFFVTKLWSYFIPTPPDAATQAALQKLYTDSNYGIRPVVEAILMHPDFYNGATMVKPPVVYTAGLMRAVGRYIDREDWIWLCDMAGQRLFYPPNVSGWDDSMWLDTSRWRARWVISNYVQMPTRATPWSKTNVYSATEDANTALGKALAVLGNPTISTETRNALSSFSANCMPAGMKSWEQSPNRAMRFNALRQLIATCPDYHTC